MFTYDDLLSEADSHDLLTKEKPLLANNGRIKGKRIAISKSLTEREKKCVLAEELGHYHTGSGDILDQSSAANRKQELRGRLWAYNKLIGLQGIISAHKAGCQSISETADHLEVTESFLRDALLCYKQKYGTYVKLDNYVIYFEPTICVCEWNSAIRRNQTLQKGSLPHPEGKDL